MTKEEEQDNIFKKWKRYFPRMTKEHALVCESMGARELNGKDLGHLEIYMRENNLKD